MRAYIRRRRHELLTAIIALVTVAVVWYVRHTRQPRPGDPVYEQYAETFERGLAVLDSGKAHGVAEAEFSRAIELYQEEPAAWANRALVRAHIDRLKEAEADLAQAEKLAPNDPQLAKLRGYLEERRGNLAEAIVSFRKALETDTGDVEALFFLGQLVRKEDGPDAAAEYQRLMERILTIRPNNQHALRERLRAAEQRGDRAAVNEVIARLKADAPMWTREETRTWFAKLERAATGPLDDTFRETCFVFTNLYTGEPDYMRHVEELESRGGYIGRPVRTFLKLAPRPAVPTGPMIPD